MLFKVPFDFVAGDQTLPAGEYFSKFDALHRLVLQGRFESWTTAVLIAFDTDQPARAKTEKGILQFERFGDLYVLSAVRRARARDWNELVKSKRALDQAKLHPERQLATILAQ